MPYHADKVAAVFPVVLADFFPSAIEVSLNSDSGGAGCFRCAVNAMDVAALVLLAVRDYPNVRSMVGLIQVYGSFCVSGAVMPNSRASLLMRSIVSSPTNTRLWAYFLAVLPSRPQMAPSCSHVMLWRALASCSALRNFLEIIKEDMFIGSPCSLRNARPLHREGHSGFLRTADTQAAPNRG
jgi:hypothetical protein